MTKVKFAFLVILFITCIKIKAQSVVVNKYFNAVDPRDEWSELLVVTDNSDMRNWTIRDNNSSQTAWQTAITFKNIAFWNNMRAGTIIILWNRVIASDGVSNHTTDVNKNDGYVEINVQNTTYFTGGTFGTTPTWAGNSLNFAGSGDVLQLRDGSNAHVHALGHCSSAGADWTALPTPKLNHANSANSGDAIYVCPGRRISNYNGPATGNAFTSKNSATLTFGLPNTCGSSVTGNTIFVDSLREPKITAQTVTPSVSIPGDITFSWASATDPYSADNAIGYMLLRKTTNSFTAPSDGTLYTVGSSLGGAIVLAELNSSATVSYTDNSVVAGSSYYYRVYAFRYSSDNINGNTFNQSRGRAYNQNNFVFVNYVAPLPIELLNFSAELIEDQVHINWSTATETNNDYFTIERSSDAIYFSPLIDIQGAGNSSTRLNYSWIDSSPIDGTSYYRLKQTDFNGSKTFSNIESVTLQSELSIGDTYPNPVNELTNIDIVSPVEKSCDLLIINMMGNEVLKNKVDLKKGKNAVSVGSNNLPAGIYIMIIKSANESHTSKFIKR